MAAFIYRGEPGRGFDAGETYHLAHTPTDDRWEPVGAAIVDEPGPEGPNAQPRDQLTPDQAAPAATDEETP